jgi:5-methylthioribose kinase
MSTELDAASAAAYLRGRGVLPEGEARVEPLGGGVSNIVLLVEAGRTRVVLKQSLPRLQVADEWLAKQARILTEGAALELYGTLAPGAAPAVLDLDPERYTLTIAAAPADWTPWKDALLAGEADPAIAARLGELLGVWHTATAGSAELRDRFGDHEAFEQLRVDPYYRTILRRHPELAEPIGRTIDAMLARRVCLVHADFSPKNVLHGAGGLWVIDAECAHVGDPAFDVAFLLNHLLLKTIHRPDTAAGYAACAGAFVAAYRTAGIDVNDGDVVAHLGCQLLARVDGKSPAEYLTAEERSRARARAVSLLRRPPADPLAAWNS